MSAPRFPLLAPEAVRANPVTEIVLHLKEGDWRTGHVDDRGRQMTPWQVADAAAQQLGRRFKCYARGTTHPRGILAWRSTRPGDAHDVVMVWATRADGRRDREFEAQVEQLVHEVVGRRP